MPRWLQFILNNPQFLLVVAFVVLPLLKTIFKAAAASKERKEARDRMERRELDAIRTGQGGGTSAAPELRGVSARQQLEAMAAQRRAEASRSASRPARTAAPPPLRTAAPPEPVTQVRLPGGLVLEIPAGDQPPPEPQRTARPTRGSGVRKSAERPRRAEPAPEPAPPARTSKPPAISPEPAVVRSSARAWLAGAALSREDWRRAIILGEVLGPPVALR